MAETPQQSGPVAVYGATGYTGKLVVAELARRGADFVIAGRNPAKLDAVAKLAGTEAPRAAVALDDARGLRELLAGCAAVINCAGPFVRYGEPVVAAAIEAGTHYIDTTGEQPWIRRVFEQFGPPAVEAGVALVPSMGFDYVPGDLIAALTAAGMGPLDELTIAYSVHGFGPSRGTAITTLNMLGDRDVEYSDGQWVPAQPLRGAVHWEFPEPIGRERMMAFPSGEQITVPQHVETGSVRTLISASLAAPHPRLAGPVAAAMPALRAALRTPLRVGLERLIARLPEGPSESRRKRGSFTISCEARAGDEVRRGTVTGSDPYGLTAECTVRGALRMATPGYDRNGALAPAQAFDPAEFLDQLAGAGVSWEVPA